MQLNGYDPQNPLIIDILSAFNDLQILIEENLQVNNAPDISEPQFNMFGCELANPATFENNEWDYGNRSIYAMKSGYSGAELKANNLRVNGTIAEGSHLYLRGDLFCGNCFGYVEAKNMVAESVGTIHNKKYFKDRSNFRIAETLVVKGQSLFAHIDSWNAEFRGLVRNSNINIGHIGVFHELGNGTVITVDPSRSYFLTYCSQTLESLTEKFKLLKKERDKLETEMTNMKYKYEKMSRVDMLKVPDLTRERIKENRLMYEDTVKQFDEADIFFINNVFEKRSAEIESLLSQLRSNAMQNAVIRIKSLVKPEVTVSFGSKSIYLTEEMENTVIRWNGSEIVLEQS